jgi:cytochrome c551/c552
MLLRKRIASLAVAAFGALALLVGPAGADPSGGANNVVLAQLTTDGATLARATTQVVPAAGDTVTSANIATAINAGCVGCHTTAVAVQILIVTGSPSYFTPGNFAGAFNGGCDSCGAFAYARQHWLQVNGPARLSGTAQLRIAQLRLEIADAAASILPSDVATDPCVTPDESSPPCPTRDEQLDEKLSGLTNELIDVVTTDLEAAGASTRLLLDRTQETSPSP